MGGRAKFRLLNRSTVIHIFLFGKLYFLTLVSFAIRQISEAVTQREAAH